MGMMNAAFDHKEGSIFGLTYLTGAVVQAARQSYFRVKGDRSAKPWPYYTQWLALIMGGVMGVFIYQSIGLKGLIIAGALVLGFVGLGFLKPLKKQRP